MSTPIKFNILKHAGDPTFYSAGSTIFKKNDPGNSMFIIVKGEVNIVVEGRSVDNLGEGEIFGEMALIDQQARSADAVARVDSQIICINEKRFLFMTDNTPGFALQVMRLMVNRLRQRMSDIESLQTYMGLLQG